MSIKTFCDGCGRETTAVSGARLCGGKTSKIQVQVLVAVDGTWNGGSVCETCVREAVVAAKMKQNWETPINRE